MDSAFALQVVAIRKRIYIYCRSHSECLINKVFCTITELAALNYVQRHICHNHFAQMETCVAQYIKLSTGG